MVAVTAMWGRTGTSHVTKQVPANLLLTTTVSSGLGERTSPVDASPDAKVDRVV